MSKSMLKIAFLVLCFINAFAFHGAIFSFVRLSSVTNSQVFNERTAPLRMSKDDDLYRTDKSKRFADVDANLVELKRPLGLVLDQDAQG